MSHALRLLLLLLLLTAVAGEFLVGKTPPAEFDMTELNGSYLPSEAIKICESHPHCAGFTYRGLLNNTLFPEKKYEIYFFRYVHFVDTDREYSNWITYKTRKHHAYYEGYFKGSRVQLPASKRNKAIEGTLNDTVPVYPGNCNTTDCAALVLDTEKGIFTDRMVEIDLNSFEPHPTIRTLFNFKVDGSNVRNTRNEMNFCCPQHDYNVDLSKWRHGIVDNLERVPCNISLEDFREQYLMPRRPVMLTGCTEQWPAMQKWRTIEQVLSRYTDDVVWKVDLGIRDDSALKFQDEKDGSRWHHIQEQLQERDDEFVTYKEVSSFEDVIMNGKDVLELMNKNLTVRIFERIGSLPRRTYRRGGTTLKKDLFEDYLWPSPLPRDLFKPTFGGTDYQWMILSQGRTGTHIHHDPHLTDAWNALISGHKYWVLLPNDVYAEHYECHDMCSKKFDDLYSVTWYEHVLPQLRNVSWYGRKIIETVQGPGEIIYVPHDVGHAVLNLDDNVSVTENFMSENVLDELAKYAAFGHNVVQYPSTDSEKRVWRNLMQRVLPRESETRSYARAMFKQVRRKKGQRGASADSSVLDDMISNSVFLDFD